MVRQEDDIQTILDLETGEIVAQKPIKEDQIYWGSNSAKIISFIITNPRKVAIWDQELNKLKEYEGKFYGPIFFGTINSLVSPTLEENLFVANLSDSTQNFIQFPKNAVHLYQFYDDSQEQVVLMTGSSFEPSKKSTSRVNQDRHLWIYSLDEDQFVKTKLFKATNFDFSDKFYSSPGIKGTVNKNIIGLSFPNQIRIYKYD